MRIKTSIFLLVLIYSNVFTTQTSLEEIRTLYKKAASSEEACCKLIKCCDMQSSFNGVVVLGYKGCASMMMAKYLIIPFRKWSKFSSGKKMLERAVKIDSSNAELRYLRFTIQTNAPSFLEYNNNISTDKIFLLKEIKTLKDVQLKKIIVEYLAQSD